MSFVKNVAVAWKPESFGFGSGCFVQFAADNADNNNCTIDGKDTFHAMGMIAAVTPASKYEQKEIPWHPLTTSDIKEAAVIVPIVPFPHKAKASS